MPSEVAQFLVGLVSATIACAAIQARPKVFGPVVFLLAVALSKYLAVAVVLGCFCVVGVLCTSFGIKPLRNSLASKAWQVSAGRIAESRIDIVNTEPVPPFVREQIRFQPYVECEYAVNGHSYSTTQISFVPMTFPTYDGAAKVADKYPVGKTVKVWLDPSEKRRAILDVNPGLQSYLLVITGIAMIVGGLVAWALRLQ